jgi:hypothetical protein
MKNKSKFFSKTVEQEGRDSFNKRIKRDNNPYKKGTKEYGSWMDGWDYEQDKAAENWIDKQHGDGNPNQKKFSSIEDKYDDEFFESHGVRFSKHEKASEGWEDLYIECDDKAYRILLKGSWRYTDLFGNAIDVDVVRRIINIYEKSYNGKVTFGSPDGPEINAFKRLFLAGLRLYDPKKSSQSSYY